MSIVKYVLLTCATVLIVNAQETRTSIPVTTVPVKAEETLTTPVPYSIYAGVYLFGKAGMKVNVAKGSKTDVVFMGTPDFGAQIMFPFMRNGNFGFGLDIGLSSYGYVNKPESNVTDDNKIIEQYQFINIFPHLNLSGVIIGVNINNVSGGSTKTNSGKDVSVDITQTTTPADYSKSLTSFSEIRAGLAIPVMDENYGRLNASLMLGYGLGGIFKDDGKNYVYAYDRDGLTLPSFSADNNPKPVSIAIGVSFLFKIPVIK